ncbi:major facilitator superfamily domain protein [Burkholderia cepacia]|nr:hypothetical protein [Burkholderia cepacia]MDW9248521.1 major facilitator superfamily domain protein [Burkholderia cepacia]QOH36972.1 hypothetical protein C7S14_3381 [Burkholderia cepacia]
MERAHRRGAEAEEIDTGSFVGHVIRQTKNGVLRTRSRRDPMRRTPLPMKPVAGRVCNRYCRTNRH